VGVQVRAGGQKKMHQLQARRLNRLAVLNAINVFVMFNIPDICQFVMDRSWSPTLDAITNDMLICRGIVSTVIFVFGNRELWKSLRQRFCAAPSTNIATTPMFSLKSFN
jgi:hypothetical protein